MVQKKPYFLPVHQLYNKYALQSTNTIKVYVLDQVLNVHHNYIKKMYYFQIFSITLNCQNETTCMSADNNRMVKNRLSALLTDYITKHRQLSAITDGPRNTVSAEILVTASRD